MESSDLIQSDHSSEEVQQTEAIIVYYIAQVWDFFEGGGVGKGL